MSLTFTSPMVVKFNFTLLKTLSYNLALISLPFISVNKTGSDHHLEKKYYLSYKEALPLFLDIVSIPQKTIRLLTY